MNSKFMNVKYLAVFLLAAVFLLLVSFDAFSQSEIDLGSVGDTASMNASQDIMREVVSYEDYQTTCTREVYDGTRSVCSEGRTETRCRKVPGVGSECWEESTGGSCSEEPTYRTETYSCTESRRVVDYVYDYTVNAKIDLVKTLRSTNYDLNGCKFGVRVAAGSESYYARCDAAILRVNIVERTETQSGRNVDRRIKLDIDFANIDGLSALKSGLQNLSYKKGAVTFETADLSAAQNFTLNLKVTRNRFLLKDKVLISRNLKPADYTLTKLEDGRVKVTVLLSKIGGDIDSKKKHTIKLDLNTVKAVDVKGAINTPGLVNSLTQSIVVND